MYVCVIYACPCTGFLSSIATALKTGHGQNHWTSPESHEPDLSPDDNLVQASVLLTIPITSQSAQLLLLLTKARLSTSMNHHGASLLLPNPPYQWWGFNQDLAVAQFTTQVAKLMLVRL